jgi:hypothetical protein
VIVGFVLVLLMNTNLLPEMRIAVLSYLQNIFLQPRPDRCTSCGLPPPLSYT